MVTKTHTTLLLLSFHVACSVSRVEDERGNTRWWGFFLLLLLLFFFIVRSRCPRSASIVPVPSRSARLSPLLRPKPPSLYRRSRSEAVAQEGEEAGVVAAAESVRPVHEQEGKGGSRYMHKSTTLRT